MPTDRRRFLVLAGAAALLAGLSAQAWRYRQALIDWLPPSRASEETLLRVVDLLIPADETPGAVDLGIHRQLAQLAREDVGFKRLLRWGGQWLDEQAERAAGPAFRHATAAVQEAILEQCAGAARGSLPERYFSRLREECFARYYARPEVWPSLGYVGPPQPMGHLDYTDAPAA